LPPQSSWPAPSGPRSRVRDRQRPTCPSDGCSRPCASRSTTCLPGHVPAPIAVVSESGRTRSDPHVPFRRRSAGEESVRGRVRNGPYSPDSGGLIRPSAEERYSDPRSAPAEMRWVELRQMRSNNRIPPCHRVGQIGHSTTVAPKPHKTTLFHHKALRSCAILNSRAIATVAPQPCSFRNPRTVAKLALHSYRRLPKWALAVLRPKWLI
jgi:hypothetical protein